MTDEPDPEEFGDPDSWEAGRPEPSRVEGCLWWGLLVGACVWIYTAVIHG